MIIKLSANSISSQAIDAVHDGSTRKLRESHWGAWLAHAKMLEEGLAVETPDALKVDPMVPGDELWNWVQPMMSAGGHIVGTPIDSTTHDEALRMGARTLSGLLNGVKFISSKPEHALPVLFVLAHKLESTEALCHLARVIGYGVEAVPDQDGGLEFKERYVLRHCRHENVAEVLRSIDMFEDKHMAEQNAPHWKQIKRSRQEGDISNKKARYIRRIISRRYPAKCVKWRTQALQTECLAPPEIDKNPVASFVERCWSLRGSSISCQLPKRPPEIVSQILCQSGFESAVSMEDEFFKSQLRLALSRKFEAFKSWIIRQHGESSGPATWSDTLSKFASSINPAINAYNEVCDADEKLMHATSFVPGDLSPEMYRREGVDTGYFFLGRGLYYCYSPVWRQDAYEACVRSLLPPEVNCVASLQNTLSVEVSSNLAYTGGHELLERLRQAGISEELFTKFLRQYYWSGAFLSVNLRLLGTQN